MAKIKASDERTFTVNAPLEEVYAFLSNGTRRAEIMSELERHEVIDDATHRYVLESKTEKGITFKGDFVVRYGGNGTDHVTWKGTKGNIDVDGSAQLKKLGDARTEVRYKETFAPDLPIPRLLAKVFSPIVSREVKKGIAEVIDAVERHFKR